jgi:penicillin amidase
MCERTFRDKLGPALYAEYLTDGRAVSALYALVADPMGGWFTDLGDPDRGGRAALAAKALDDAARDLTVRFGSSDRWRWGELHTALFEHPLAVFPLSLLLNIGPVRRPGDGYSPNNGAYALTTPFKLRSHSSERQIVDLADVDASISIIPTGESGQPFSKHWGDQTQMWANGEYKPMPLSRERIGQLEGRLIVRPR